jgi:UDP-N-acetylmuramate dehydrogenase
MSRHCTWRVGGPAALWVVVETEEALLEAVGLIREANERVVPVDGQHLWVGDGGADGVWLRLGACAEGISRDGLQLRCGRPDPCGGLGQLRPPRGPHRPGGLQPRLRAPSPSCSAETSRRRPWWGCGCCAAVASPRWCPASSKTTTSSCGPALSLNPAQALKGGRAPKRGLGLPGRLFLDPKKNHNAAEMMSELGLRGVRLRSARLGGYEPNTLINLGGAKENDLKVLIGMVKDRAKSHLGVDLNPELKPLGRSRRSDG